ncbi:hypothetical protein [Nodosilinea sp. P-1105]|uniref:hypothetical protein n=1 Tax=Nodosilinea sp. P-1105 TaxID=2546229 RepID=UPI00146EEA79|nr:hypothetical protein [Nodosilinea sp. P-1105]NMF85961.1 hypothetical protein [Nodosilinea sp. P-1105]
MSELPAILSHDSPGFHLAETWQREPKADIDPVVWAIHYLQALRDLAVQADWITLDDGATPPTAALIGIGQHVHGINRQLDWILQHFLACFEIAQQPQVQVFAAPIMAQAGIDGFCNFQHHPITLMVDPSRILAADWPHLVAHELAHGIAHSDGHGHRFKQALDHLCLAHDLPLAPDNSLETNVLPYWPPCRKNPSHDRFWLELSHLGPLDMNRPTVADT